MKAKFLINFVNPLVGYIHYVNHRGYILYPNIILSDFAHFLSDITNLHIVLVLIFASENSKELNFWDTAVRYSIWYETVIILNLDSNLLKLNSLKHKTFHSRQHLHYHHKIQVLILWWSFFYAQFYLIVLVSGINLLYN